MRIAVFASGGGTNFQAILDAIQRGELPAEVCLLVTDRPTAGAIERARTHEIPVAILPPVEYETEEAYIHTLLERLDEHRINFIALAGYLKKIPAEIVQRYYGRMINIHPSLLPAFGGKGMYGIRVHRAVLEYGAQWTGATVHLVDEEYDHGAIILQEPVPVFPGDTPEELAARVLRVEHRLYPRALCLFAEGRIEINGRTVTINPVHYESDNPREDEARS